MGDSGRTKRHFGFWVGDFGLGQGWIANLARPSALDRGAFGCFELFFDKGTLLEIIGGY